MKSYRIQLLPLNQEFTVGEGLTVLDALRMAHLHPDAPCGGKGSCGKCKVFIDGREHLACQTPVSRDMVVVLPKAQASSILTQGTSVSVQPDGTHAYVLAFDIGTTTVVAYLLDGKTGQLLARASVLNPQTAFGADVISRIQHVLDTQTKDLCTSIRTALHNLTLETAKEAGIDPEEISLAVAVGNTAMHHLLLGIDPKPLTVPPYMPAVSEAVSLPSKEFLPISKEGTLQILPNIAGFVGADTVACLTATGFDQLENLTLLIDIGTNGEMVLGNQKRRLACSTAAGPAFEGAKISCGMRGVQGAIDRVWLEQGTVRWHTIGDTKPAGLCGSGLLDLIAVLLELELIDETGRLEGGQEYCLEGTSVVLTQKDIREVQLAKAAIRAGIELMAQSLGVAVDDIQTVLLAGAFGNYMNPASACQIGMIPPCLQAKIQGIGNAAGEGAKLCALSQKEWEHSRVLAQNTEFLELATLPQFQDQYVDALMFGEDE